MTVPFVASKTHAQTVYKSWASLENTKDYSQKLWQVYSLLGGMYVWKKSSLSGMQCTKMMIYLIAQLSSASYSTFRHGEVVT